MNNELFDLGQTELFDAEAIGQPGNRRFRLFARSRRGTASLWLEREQLERLSLAIDQVLAEISGGEMLRPEAMANVMLPPGAPDDFPVQPDIEFQVSAMQLGYDEERDVVLLRAAPLELIEQDDGELTVREDVEPQFSALMSRGQAMQLTTHILSILAGGRPRCPFCGRPMEARHICEKQNGYHPVGLN